MNLFGCKFCTVKDDGEKECSRKNFDSLSWAMITVFQVKIKVHLVYKYIIKQIAYFIDFNSRRLERGVVQWNGKNI